MLDIQVNGQSVDLPENIQLALTFENPFLAKDRIPIPYSLTIELPFTQHNLSLFGYPNRIGSTQRDKKYTCEIFFKGVRITSGSLQIEGVRETIRVSYVGASINDLAHPLYENDLGKQVFQGIHVEVNYDSTSNFAYNYKEWAANRQQLQEDYLFSPISIKNTMMPTSVFTPLDGDRIPDFNIFPKFIQQKVREMFENAFEMKRPEKTTNLEFINGWNNITENFLRGDSPSDRIDKYHSPMFPAFRVGWLMDKILKDNLVNNLFNENPNDTPYRLVVPTFYFPTWKETEYADMSINSFGQRHYPPMVSNPRPKANKPYPSQPYVELADFLPNYSTSKFIKEVIKLFGITIVALKGKLHMKWNNDILSAPVSKDWSSKRLDSYDITQEKGKIAKFKYKSSQSNTNKDEAISVARMLDVAKYPWQLNEQRSYSQLFHVQDSDQYIAKTVTEKEVQLLGEGTWLERNINYSEERDGFGSDQDDDSNNETLEPELTPLTDSVSIDFQDLRNDVRSTDRFAYITPTIELSDRTIRPTTLHIALYQGIDITILENGLTDSKLYYRLSSYATGTAGIKKTLQWRYNHDTSGEIGMIEKYHTQWADWVQKDKVKLSAVILLDVLDLHNLDVTEKIHIDGRNFFIDKIQFTITRDHIQPAEIDLIEC